MRNIRTEAIVIKRRSLGEADRLVTVITPNFGKMTIKAKGVRKITSRRSAHIELLNHVQLSLYKGAGMHVLTEAKMIEDFSLIKADFTKIGCAYHICELIDGLCPDNQENGRVYYLLKKTLMQMAQIQEVLGIPKTDHSDIDDYTLGTFGIGLSDAPKSVSLPSESKLSTTIHNFEIDLLSDLGYWDKSNVSTKNFDTHALIESILERKLKSHSMFSKLQ